MVGNCNNGCVEGTNVPKTNEDFDVCEPISTDCVSHPDGDIMTSTLGGATLRVVINNMLTYIKELESRIYKLENN